MKLTPACERALDQRGRALLLDRADRPPEAGAAVERHRPEADFRNELAGAAERTIMHEEMPFR